jgi:hypothetical protein
MSDGLRSGPYAIAKGVAIAAENAGFYYGLVGRGAFSHGLDPLRSFGALTLKATLRRDTRQSLAKIVGRVRPLRPGLRAQPLEAFTSTSHPARKLTEAVFWNVGLIFSTGTRGRIRRIRTLRCGNNGRDTDLRCEYPAKECWGCADR